MAAKTVLFYDRERKRAQVWAEAWAEGFAKGIAKARAEAIAEAIAEQDRKWQGWVARGDAAREKGLPFDEPPPAPIG